MEQVKMFIGDGDTFKEHENHFSKAINDWLTEKGESIEITRVVQSSAGGYSERFGFASRTIHIIYYKNKNLS